MTQAFLFLVAQAIFIQMVFSQSPNINFNPSTTSPSPSKGPTTGPINSKGPINSNPLSGPVGSNNKGSLPGAIGSSLSNFSKRPATVAINSNPTLGPINSSHSWGPVGLNNKGPFAGAAGSNLSNKVGFIGATGPNFGLAGPIGQGFKGIPVSGGSLGTLGTSTFGFGPATFGPSQYGPNPYGPGPYGPSPFISTGNGNVAVNGELPVAGNTGVIGQVPVTGNVQFNGKVPASGAVTITGVCSCGAPGFNGFK